MILRAEAAAYLKDAVARDLNEAECTELLTQLLSQAWTDGHEAAGRCSDCGSVHADPLVMLRHIQATLAKGFAVTQDTPYPCHNTVSMLEALTEYLVQHPVPT